MVCKPRDFPNFPSFSHYFPHHFPQYALPPGATPDSISPSEPSKTSTTSEGSEPPQSPNPMKSFEDLQKSLEAKLGLGSPRKPSSLSPSTAASTTGTDSPSAGTKAKSGPLSMRLERLSQPKAARSDKEPIEPFVNTLRTSYLQSSKKAPGGTPPGENNRDKSPAVRLRDKSPSPAGSSAPSASSSAVRLRDKSPLPAGSTTSAPVRVRDKSPSVGSSLSGPLGRTGAPIQQTASSVAKMRDKSPMVQKSVSSTQRSPAGTVPSSPSGSLRDTSPSPRNAARFRDVSPLPSSRSPISPREKSAPLPPTSRKLMFDREDKVEPLFLHFIPLNNVKFLTSKSLEMLK